MAGEAACAQRPRGAAAGARAPAGDEAPAGAFVGRLFPASCTILHCPIEECPGEAPFVGGDALLDHLAGEHGFGVADANAIAPLLDRYLAARYCSLAAGRPAGTAPFFSVLSEEDDRSLRARLQQERLAEILAHQEAERASAHRRPRGCLFCEAWCESKAALFRHMFTVHAFNIGQLDNIVMVDEFLDILEGKLAAKQCIYCEKVFPNMPTLKKHLKNKNHYRISSAAHIYDRFYVVNYLNVGQLYDASKDDEEGAEEGAVAATAGRSEACGTAPPLSAQARRDVDLSWETLEDPVDEQSLCLLCSHSSPTMQACAEHMAAVHRSFSWPAVQALDTYDAIKVVNYMRTALASVACAFCTAPALSAKGGDDDDNDDDDDDSLFARAFDDEGQLVSHLGEEHDFAVESSIPERRLWDSPRFLFPIFDDDPLLCHAFCTDGGEHALD